MNANRLLKVGICVIAGAAAGLAVYNSVKRGFSSNDVSIAGNGIEPKPDLQQFGGGDPFKVQSSSSQIATMPGCNQRPYQVGDEYRLDLTPPTQQLVPQQAETKEETKTDILQKGLCSAVNACMVVVAAAQCISGIAEGINRIRAIFKDGGNNNGMMQSQYCNYQGGYCGNIVPQGINMGNGQYWYRINPYGIDTRNPQVYNTQCFGGYNNNIQNKYII